MTGAYIQVRNAENVCRVSAPVSALRLLAHTQAACCMMGADIQVCSAAHVCCVSAPVSASSLLAHTHTHRQPAV